jgi:hypothetical protein
MESKLTRHAAGLAASRKQHGRGAIRRAVVEGRLSGARIGSLEAGSRRTRLTFPVRSRVRRPENRVQRVVAAPSSAAFACTTWRSTLAGKKTTFAKLAREQKVRDKRQARSLRKEQRLREADAAGDMQPQAEDLSHLDVAVVEGVLPDGVVER